MSFQPLYVYVLTLYFASCNKQQHNLGRAADVNKHCRTVEKLRVLYCGEKVLLQSRGVRGYHQQLLSSFSSSVILSSLFLSRLFDSLPFLSIALTLRKAMASQEFSS